MESAHHDIGHTGPGRKFKKLLSMFHKHSISFDFIHSKIVWLSNWITSWLIPLFMCYFSSWFFRLWLQKNMVHMDVMLEKMVVLPQIYPGKFPHWSHLLSQTNVLKFLHLQLERRLGFCKGGYWKNRIQRENKNSNWCCCYWILHRWRSLSYKMTLLP